MRVLNRHSRRCRVSPKVVGEILDTLASRADGLWPFERWPPMRLNGPLGVGRRGGHGPVRYAVESYDPGRQIVFRFSAPRGFHGTHSFSIEEEEGGCLLCHIIEMKVSGWALLSWPLAFRPLHDALLEDALDKVEAAVAGSEWTRRELPPWVRLLRWALARRRKGP